MSVAPNPKIMLKILYSIIILVGLLCSACNGDIFDERIPDVVDSITLPGFEGRGFVKFQRKGLHKIILENYYAPHALPRYYDRNGNEMRSPSDINEVERIVYSSNMFAVEFILKEDGAEIFVIDNAYVEGLTMFFILDYGYMEKSVQLEIEGGKRHVISYLGYDISNPVGGTTTDQGLRQNLVNDGEQPLRMEIYPYQEVKTVLRLKPSEWQSWSYGSTGKVQIPGYVDGEWRLSEPMEAEVTIGETMYLSCPYIDELEKVYVEVPPHSFVRVDVTIVYATLSTGYHASINLPGFDASWNVSGTYNLKQPIDYRMVTTQLDI